MKSKNKKFVRKIIMQPKEVERIPFSIQPVFGKILDFRAKNLKDWTSAYFDNFFCYHRKPTEQ